MPRQHQYVAWFRNPVRPPNKQDHQWCACFVVIATTEAGALSWADDVARDYAARNGLVLFRSYVDPEPWDGTVPRVVAGSRVSDEDIGW